MQSFTLAKGGGVCICGPQALQMPDMLLRDFGSETQSMPVACPVHTACQIHLS